MSATRGLGKTHLSVAIGLKVLQRGYTIRFRTAQASLNQVLPGGTSRAANES